MMRASVGPSLLVGMLACGDAGSGTTATTGTTGATTTTDGATTGGATGGDSTNEASDGTGGGSGGSGSGTGGSTGGVGPACDEVPGLIDAYKAAHPGNGGKDWDINAKTDAELMGDPLAQQLLALCGPDQRPVIPAMAWEYGGNDHMWTSPAASAWFYCVYIPVNPGTEHWQFDVGAQKVTADMTIGCPEHNPCNGDVGAQQVLGCLGDPSNVEILVDTMSRNDGLDVGYDLSEAGTDVYLLLPDQTRVFVINVP